jgi:hypothetical protein
MHENLHITCAPQSNQCVILGMNLRDVLVPVVQLKLHIVYDRVHADGILPAIWSKSML